MGSVVLDGEVGGFAFRAWGGKVGSLNSGACLWLHLPLGLGSAY